MVRGSLIAGYVGDLAPSRSIRAYNQGKETLPARLLRTHMNKRSTALIGIMDALVLSLAIAGTAYAETGAGSSSPAHQGWFMSLIGKIGSFFRHSDGGKKDGDKVRGPLGPASKGNVAGGTVTAISGADITVSARNGSNATTTTVIHASGATIRVGSAAATSSILAIAIGDRLIAYGSSTDSGFSAKTVFVGSEETLKKLDSQVKSFGGRGSGGEGGNDRFGPAQPFRDERPR